MSKAVLTNKPRADGQDNGEYNPRCAALVSCVARDWAKRVALNPASSNCRSLGHSGSCLLVPTPRTGYKIRARGRWCPGEI